VKEHTDYFQDLCFGRRDFEIRCADRDYREGDFLLVREWDHLRAHYTGRTRLSRIDKVFPAHRIAPVPTLMDGMVLLRLGAVPGGIGGVIEASQKGGTVRCSQANASRSELGDEETF
jgi:hypothetical protein